MEYLICTLRWENHEGEYTDPDTQDLVNDGVGANFSGGKLDTMSISPCLQV